MNEQEVELPVMDKFPEDQLYENEAERWSVYEHGFEFRLTKTKAYPWGVYPMVWRPEEPTGAEQRAFPLRYDQMREVAHTLEQLANEMERAWMRLSTEEKENENERLAKIVAQGQEAAEVTLLTNER